jgi:bifunctional non-homologous end joining protein LigD
VKKKTSDKEITHPMAEKAADLAYLANQGAISLHVWLSRKDKPETPDMLVFDLDPPEGGSFGVVRQAAKDLHELMDELGLAAYVKTTGSKGLHVISPLSRGSSFKEVRDFAGHAAKLLAHRNPDDYTVAFSKDKRQGKLFLDTRRNAYAQTIAAPYSVRARPGAPVAMPLSWDEAGDSSIGPRTFTIENAFKRLGQKDDPWAGMRRHGRDLKEPGRKLKKLMAEAGLD